MAKSGMFIRRHIDGSGKDYFTIHFTVDEIINQSSHVVPVCKLPTLEQAVMVCRYINGGYMDKDERESVHVALCLKGGRKKRAKDV